MMRRTQIFWPEQDATEKVHSSNSNDAVESELEDIINQNKRTVDMENTEAKLRVRMSFSDAHYAGNLVVKNSIL